MKTCKDTAGAQLIQHIETFLTDYVTFPDPAYSLPIALWIIGTFCFESFDTFPYFVITSATKRSGKTRLGEIISFCCNKPENFAAMTGPTFYRIIEQEKPTIIFDEAEKLSSEAASTMRSVLNVGYRKGQSIPRTMGNKVIRFDTYCPKAFILIGDVYDTLRDRSILITMVRAEALKRFTIDAAVREGSELRTAAGKAINGHSDEIAAAFQDHAGLNFLMDRDEEIWTPLFVLCSIFAPERMKELARTAVDLSTEKTAEARRYTALKTSESSATDDEYSKRLLTDLYGLFLAGGFKAITTKDAIEQLKNLPTSPWRKYKGRGLTVHNMSAMLSRFGVNPVNIRIGNKVPKGYKAENVNAGMGKL